MIDFHVTIAGIDPRAWNRQVQDGFDRIVPRVMQQAEADLLISARTAATRGRPGLRKISGRLERGIKTHLQEFSITRATLRVGVDLDEVPYARIQEFGGVIRPKASPYLRFQINGRWVQARQVTIPARPYLEPSRDDVFARLPRIAERVIEEVMP